MSTSDQVKWIDSLDPYCIQRVVLHKAMFIATLLVYTYWMWQPSDLTAYISPIFVASLYEIPGPTQKEREKNILFALLTMAFCGLTFFLLYPFKFTFLFYALIFLLGLFFIIQRYFPVFKYAIMLIIINGALNLTVERIPDLQLAYGLVSSVLLSIAVIYLGLNLFPANYFRIWCRATQRLLTCLEQEVTQRIPITSMKYEEEVQHLNMMRCYYKWLPLHQLRHAAKITVNIRNIQFAISHCICLDEIKENREVWHLITRQLRHLKLAMTHHLPYPHRKARIQAKTASQQRVINYLENVILHWNKLCQPPSAN